MGLYLVCKFHLGMGYYLDFSFFKILEIPNKILNSLMLSMDL